MTKRGILADSRNVEERRCPGNQVKDQEFEGRNLPSVFVAGHTTFRLASFVNATYIPLVKRVGMEKAPYI